MTGEGASIRPVVKTMFHTARQEQIWFVLEPAGRGDGGGSLAGTAGNNVWIIRVPSATPTGGCDSPRRSGNRPGIPCLVFASRRYCWWC